MVFTCPIPICPRALKYTQFITDLKHLWESVGWGSGYTGYSYSRGEPKYIVQLGMSGTCIKLLGDWRLEAY